MNSISPQTMDALESIRHTTQEVFDDQKLTVQQVIQVISQELPARIISYQYYGNSNLGSNLSKLNDEINVSFLGGEIEILTQ